MSAIKSIGTPFYFISKIGNSLQSVFLLIIRLFWGLMFFYAGMGKMNDIEGTATAFEALLIPLPLMTAYLVAFFEYVGGACLILGLGTRLMCIPLIIIMLVALFTAHQAEVLQFAQNPTLTLAQSPVTFLIAVLILFVFGPGKISLDYVFRRLFLKNHVQK